MSPTSSKGLSRQVRGGIWIVIGRLAAGVSQILLLMILSRVMSQAQVGEVLLLVSAAGVLAVVCRFGLDILVGKEIALLCGSGRAGDVYSVALTHFRGLCIMGCVVGVVLLLLLRVLEVPSDVSRDMGRTWIAGLLGLWAFGLALQFFVGEALRGMADVAASVWFGGLSSQLLGLSGVALFANRAAMPAVAEVSMLMSGVALGVGGVGAAYLFRRLRAAGPSATGLAHYRFVALFKESVPIFLNTLVLAVALAADLWVVALFFDAGTVSVYGAAARLGMLLSLGLVVMAGVLLPTVGEALGCGGGGGAEGVLRTWASWVGLGSLVLWLALLFLGQPLLTALYGASFATGAGVLVAIAGGYALGNWFGVGQQVLIGGGFGVRVLAITLASLVLTLALSIGLAAAGWLSGVAGGVAAGVVARQYGFAREARRLCGLRSAGALPLLMAHRRAARDAR
jgi:O-antigen/teichoic acid export membrane protein